MIRTSLKNHATGTKGPTLEKHVDSNHNWNTFEVLLHTLYTITSSVISNVIFHYHLSFLCDISKQKYKSLLLRSVLYSGHAEGENDKTLLCLMSIVYHWGRGGRRLGALQELLSHHSGKQGDERWNLCLSWQPGTVTMAQIARAQRKLQQTAANCGAAREEEEAAAGAMRSRLFVSLSPTQTARVPACHQGHTDGSLQGGCGCITDLRAKVGLCSNPHFYSHWN